MIVDSLCQCKPQNEPLGDFGPLISRRVNAVNFNFGFGSAEVAPFPMAAVNANFPSSQGSWGDVNWTYNSTPPTRFEFTTTGPGQFSRSLRCGVGPAIDAVLGEYERYPRFPNNHTWFYDFRLLSSNDFAAHRFELGNKFWNVEHGFGGTEANEVTFDRNNMEGHPSLAELRDPNMTYDHWVYNSIPATRSQADTTYSWLCQARFELMANWSRVALEQGTKQVAYVIPEGQTGNGALSWDKPAGRLNETGGAGAAGFTNINRSSVRSPDSETADMVSNPSAAPTTTTEAQIHIWVPGNVVVSLGGGPGQALVRDDILRWGMTPILRIEYRETVQGQSPTVDMQFYRAPTSWPGGSSLGVFTPFRSRMHGQQETTAIDPRFPSEIQIVYV